MGRLGLRAGWSMDELTFVRVNETACDAAASTHLLTFDSVHGTWDKSCSGDGNALRIDDSELGYSSNTVIADTDWSGCDIVIDATGAHREPEPLQAYFDQGVKKVIVAAPVDGALNIVYVVNDHLYDPKQNHLLTAASCTTNCLAPVIKVLQEQIGIRHGSMTTIHDITNTQTIVDKSHKDLL